MLYYYFLNVVPLINIAAELNFYANFSWNKNVTPSAKNVNDFPPVPLKQIKHIPKIIKRFLHTPGTVRVFPLTFLYTHHDCAN